MHSDASDDEERSDDVDSRKKRRPNPEESDTSSDERISAGNSNSDQYDDPEPKPKKKFKKGQKKWDHKRRFDIPDYGDDDDVDPDGYAAIVKRGLDEVYRIPQGIFGRGGGG